MTEATPNPETVLSDQLHKKPENSRKYTMTKFGVYTVLYVFTSCLILFLIRPDTAGQIVMLAQIVVGAISLIVGVFCGAQASVDYNNATSLASVVESKKNETRNESLNVNVTEAVDPKIVRQFAEKYKDDPSYRPPNTIADVPTFR